VRKALVTLFVGMLLSPVPAWGGGGSTFEFGDRYDRADEYLPVGQRVVGHMDVAFDTRREHRFGPFYAYLRPHTTTWGKPPGIPNGAVPLGPIDLMNIKPGKWTSADARLDFTVPDVKPGRYLIEYCNDPCTHAMSQGDGNWPTFVVITPTVAEARMRARVDNLQAHLESKIYRADKRARHGERRAERSFLANDATTERTAALEEQVESLASEVRRLKRAGSDGQPWVPIATAFLAGVALAYATLLNRLPKSQLAEQRKTDAPSVGPEDRHALRPEADFVAGHFGGFDRRERDRRRARRGQGHDGELV
jgi:hypothetical protein